MAKMHGVMMGTLVGLGLALAGCGQGSGAEPSGNGLTSVAVRGLSASQIYSLVITAQPANVSKTLGYDSATGLFGGKLVLPAGTHTLTAEGYGSDPSAGVVASGTGTVTVEPNTTTTVTLRIHDQTPMQGQQDIAPIIRSVSASKADLVVNEPITVAVDAVDLDGDAMSYVWTSDCASGSFGDPTAATTTWSSTAPASCTLKVAVSSRSQNLNESVVVLVYSAPGGGGEGGAQVNGEYVARPQVSRLNMSGPGVYQTLYRGDMWSTANFRPVAAGQQYSLEMSVNFDTYFGTFETGLDASCGTLEKQYDSCGTGGYCYVNYLWTAPAAGSVCKLTATAANGSLTDSFSAGVFVRQ
ncbi:hypothetical protein [Archangium sp.]|uniref:hypothetical protein n=1 Tax=Archangium sp. TaxID=1872627 RepID=UPI002D666F86|nr:hypothetical protein [Archangium sp.]HYO57655.1 hypothetical protein [Archangium sp.]